MGKRSIRKAINLIHLADEELQRLREAQNAGEWGDQEYSDLGIALSLAQRLLTDAQNRLDEVLAKFKGKRLGPNFPGKKGKKAVNIRDLQKGLCC